MISFARAASFAFSRRSFIIGSSLLFLTLFLIMTLTYTLYRLGPEYLQGLDHLSAATWGKIGYTFYVIKSLFYSVLFSYLFILAKKEVYNQSTRFSSEFFYKVLAAIFAFGLIIDLVLYAGSDYAVNWIASKAIQIAQNPTKLEVIKAIVTALFFIALVAYIVVAFYMAYLMHFNFSQFSFKLRHAFSSPLTFLKMVGLFILFILLSMIPIVGLYFVMGSFDARSVVMTFMPCIMGTTSSMALVFYTILIGLPLGIFCTTTTGGRIFGACVTLWYFILYGFLRFVGMPALPISALLYIYVFFFLINLLYITFTIIYPSFWINLLAQGALEVNQKFDPSVGVSEEERFLIETTNNPAITTENKGENPNSLQNNFSTNIESDKMTTGEILAKGLIFGLLFLIVGTCVVFYVKGHQPSFTERIYKNSDIKVKYLRGDALEFLQRYYPPRKKKLVVYFPDPHNPQLPIDDNLKKVIFSLKKQWQEYYDFMPQIISGKTTREDVHKIASQMEEFTNNICGDVCIVDTNEHWVFSVKRANLLEVSLKEFK